MANEFKNKVVYNGHILIDLTSDSVAGRGDIRYGKTGHTASGAVVSGTLRPRPAWLSEGDDAVWDHAYFNREVDWGAVLPTLTYDSYDKCIVGASLPGTGGPLATGMFVALRAVIGYALIYLSGLTATPIYATAAGVYAYSSDGDPIAVNAAAGWNTVAVPMPEGTLSCFFAFGASDLTQVAAGTPLAFGDYRPAPTGSITVNANGVYRNLWQYAEVVINVPTSGGGEDATVDGNALVFDGDTAVDGNTLTLALDATVEGKTLVISGDSESDATVDGNTLTVNGTADGAVLRLDATVDDNVLMI